MMPRRTAARDEEITQRRGSQMDVFVGVPWIFRSAIRRLGQTSTILVVIAVLIITVLVSAGIMWVVEVAGGGAGPQTYGEALWWHIVAITGVGLEAHGPATGIGHAAGATGLLMSRIFFGMFTAAVAAALINRLLLEGKGMGSVVLRNHVVICGWNGKGSDIVNMLMRDEHKESVVILNNLPEDPIHHPGVTFVHGDPANEKDLRRAGVDDAATVVILADETIPGLNDMTTDARSVLVALAADAVNPHVYTFAEIKQPQNRQHFVRANVNEMIVTNEFVSDLMARASVYHGLSHVIHDLLTPKTNSDFYIIPAPHDLIGKSFEDALIHLQLTHRAILVGVKRNGVLDVNPEAPVSLAEGDELVVISRGLIPPDKPAPAQVPATVAPASTPVAVAPAARPASAHAVPAQEPHE
jgi:voltage-gated potassium channel